MKQGISLQELSTEVKRVNDTKHDYVLDTRNCRVDVVDGEPMFRVTVDPSDPVEGTKLLKINKTCHDQLLGSECTDIPLKYGRRMIAEAPGLYADNVNHWLHNNPMSKMLRCIEDHARALVSTGYRRLDNYDMLAHLLPVVSEAGNGDLVRIGDVDWLDQPGPDGPVNFPKWVVASSQLTEDKLYLKIVFPRIAGALAKPHKHSQDNPPGWLGGHRGNHNWTRGLAFPMVTISNSEVGKGSVAIVPGILDGGCDNGAALETFAKRRAHIGRKETVEEDYARTLISDETRQVEDRAFWMSCRDVLRATLTEDTFRKILAKANEAYGMPIEGDKIAATQVLSQKYGLGEDERDRVLQALIDGADYSLGGLVDAVTWVAQGVDDYSRASELESLGGQLLTMGKGDWKEIANARAN